MPTFGPHVAMRKWSCARFRPSTLLSLFTAAHRPGHIVRYRDLLSSAGLLRAAFAFALCPVTANSFAQSAALPVARPAAVNAASRRSRAHQLAEILEELEAIKRSASAQASRKC